ncbi:hypothetical protein FEM48_Zijuj11G0053300 [Ziziphus jujuba var. spinosa]|uniref:Uncharacterized protein n=1 Tax=Ziziphus jujuba var. spinosa TaxID=714518 RepID=A0A978UH23_ZIZJJ|nr:hypothetical protein FEM48_Zijuj11G0053300 [Ziziphus jujuba var. spinosa]
MPTTKEQDHLLKDRLVSIKKGSSTTDEYLKKFKQFFDSLATINAPVLKVDKVFSFATGLGQNYKDFKIAMLTKPPYPTFNQFVLALQSHDQLMETETEGK